MNHKIKENKGKRRAKPHKQESDELSEKIWNHKGMILGGTWSRRKKENKKIEFLEPCSGLDRMEIDALVHRIDLNRGLIGPRQSPFSPLTRGAQPRQSPRVSSHVVVMLVPELLDKKVNHSFVEILASGGRIIGSQIHLVVTILDV